MCFVLSKAVDFSIVIGSLVFLREKAVGENIYGLSVTPLAIVDLSSAGPTPCA
jgi:hypothetical protein